MVESHTEMAHILGLLDNPFMSILPNEGWFNFLGVPTIRRRYKQYTGLDLNFHLHSSKLFSNLSAILSKMSHGSYIGFTIQWRRHSYSFHTVRDGAQTHFIYVNKGQRHYSNIDNEYKKPATDVNVIVFTIDAPKDQDIANELVTAATSKHRRLAISKFIHKHAAYRNFALENTLVKKYQKVGNCVTSNSNIAWHFQLAANHMQESAVKNPDSPISFARAYVETTSSYKRLRIKDRIEAFQYLLSNKQTYISKKAFRYNFFQALLKFAAKGRDSYAIALVDRLESRFLNILISLLITDEYIRNFEEFFTAYLKKGPDNKPSIIDEWNSFSNLRNLILSRAFTKMPAENQKALINKNISLLAYSTEKVQQEFLKKDFAKYSIFASPEYSKLKKHSEYLGYRHQCELIISERKTSPRLGPKKESLINSKFRAIYSYAFNQSSENLAKAIEDLYLTCCEQRLTLTGGRSFSSNTHSAKWLVSRIAENDDLATRLKFILNVKNSTELGNKLATIVNENNQGKKKYRGLFSSKATAAIEVDETKPNSKKIK